MLKISEKIANLLITLECVQLRPQKPFTYASGLKGPIYTDNRKLLSNVEARNIVRDGFCELIKQKKLSYDYVAGMATAGIAHAALVADKLAEPMVYVRSKAKGHGKQNQVEGGYKDGDKLLLIEDLVNQGKSLGEGIDGVRNAGLVVESCLTIVDYQMENAAQVMRDKNVQLYSLTTFEELVKAGVRLGKLDESSSALLKKWQQDPVNWQ